MFNMCRQKTKHNSKYIKLMLSIFKMDLCGRNYMKTVSTPIMFRELRRVFNTDLCYILCY